MGLISCNSDRIYSDYQTFDSNTLHKDSLVKFDVEISDTSQFYDIKILVRVLDLYPNENLWLFVNTSNSQIVQKDTINCLLFDQKGKCLGDALGGVYDYEIPFKQEVKFYKPGIYTFSLMHGMRMDILPQISQLGIIIEKCQKTN